LRAGERERGREGAPVDKPKQFCAFISTRVFDSHGDEAYQVSGGYNLYGRI